MSRALIVGVVVFIVLILGAVLAGALVGAGPAKAKFTRENATNYVYGMVNPKSNSSDGNVKYLGDFTAQDGCESACGDQTWCNGYTWHDGNGGDYANQCFGLATLGSKTPQDGHWSGSKAESFNVRPLATRAKANAVTFSNTLQRRLGMSSAAEKFDIVDPTVGAGTNWSGYMKPSVLPLA